MGKVVNSYSYVIYFILLFCFAYGYPLDEDNRREHQQVKSKTPTKFITLGHSRAVLKDPQKRELFINHINSENADYVFILGDASAWQEEIASEYDSKIKAEVYFIPGNHDLMNPLFEEDRKTKYLKSVGYLEKTLVFDDCNFILINSSESIKHLNNFLNTALTKINPNNVTILLTHHRVWDDNLLSDLPYEHDKSYYFNELLPQIDGNIDYIFAGNGPRQYFRQEKKNTNGNLVYWCDMVNGIICYSNGMSGGKMSFLVVEVDSKKLIVTPRFFTDSITELDKPGWVMTKVSEATQWNQLLKKFKHRAFWVGLIFGVVLATVPFFLKFVFSRRSNGEK